MPELVPLKDPAGMIGRPLLKAWGLTPRDFDRPLVEVLKSLATPPAETMAISCLWGIDRSPNVFQSLMIVRELLRESDRPQMSQVEMVIDEVLKKLGDLLIAKNVTITQHIQATVSDGEARQAHLILPRLLNCEVSAFGLSPDFSRIMMLAIQTQTASAGALAVTDT